jgi:hypothetical protein
VIIITPSLRLTGQRPGPGLGEEGRRLAELGDVSRRQRPEGEQRRGEREGASVEEEDASYPKPRQEQGCDERAERLSTVGPDPDGGGVRAAQIAIVYENRDGGPRRRCEHPPGHRAQPHQDQQHR